MTSIVIALLSFGLRIWHLATPKGLVFDELYYVNGARDYLKYGVEVKGSSAEFIVHPPVGKWCIALGIKIFGNHEFGWRISAAVAGALTIYLVSRIAKRLFHSTQLANLAALLMALDGLNLVHSRTSLLDLFLTLFVLLGVNAWLKEHYWWSGIFFALASATKWSGLYFLVAFGLYTIYRDRVRIQTWTRLLSLRVLQFGIVPVMVYTATWIGWFRSSRGWDRHWADQNGSSWKIIPSPLRSLWHYHAEILHFHRTLIEKHTYQANPWGWLVMRRPTSFFYESPKTCGAKDCSQEVLALGTPLLWWLGTLAIATLAALWLRSILRRQIDSTASVILLGVAASYLPWFFFQKRTVFEFYAIVIEPFLILALVYCVKKFLGPRPRNRNRKLIVGLFVLLIAANFIYFWPLFTATVITYSHWSRLMWFSSWI
jgi:dolichyl-phosphate-mannose--protein O-mannosyl transferase